MADAKLLIVLIALIFWTPVSVVDLPDARDCFSKDKVCFGAKDKQKSYSDAKGCLKEDNCDIQIIGVRTDANYMWYFKTIWKADNYDTLIGYLSISNLSVPFDANRGYFEIELRRETDPTPDGGELLSNGSRVVIGKKSDANYARVNCNSKDAGIHCYQFMTSFIDEEESIIIYKSSIIINFGDQLVIDLEKDKLFIHLKLLINSISKRGTPAISTGNAFKLFQTKDANNSPDQELFQTPIFPSTPNQTPTSPSTPNQTLSKNNQKKEGFSSVYVILIVIGVLIIVGVCICVYIFIIRKNKKAIKSNESISQKEIIKAIRQSNLEDKGQSKVKGQSTVKGRSEMNSGRLKKVGSIETPKDDGYSTYFKPK